MNLTEYNKVKDLSYSKYCDYLQKKYGIPSKPYFNKNFVKNTGITKTGEGLFLHHIKEDTAIMLYNKDFAKNNPYEFQLPENLVYCDYLEHLLLHIMICESPNPDANAGELVGVGGAKNLLAPELNDIYGGFIPKMGWKAKCYDRVKGNFDVYKELIKRFKKNCAVCMGYDKNLLYSSFNETYGNWSSKNNAAVIEELRKL